MKTKTKGQYTYEAHCWSPGLPSGTVQRACEEALQRDIYFHGKKEALPTTPGYYAKHDDLILMGFSAGCHDLRNNLVALDKIKERPTFVVLADGMHTRKDASMPEAPYRALIEAAMRADEGAPEVFVSHTYLTYTDTLRDDPRTPQVERAFNSTLTTIQNMTGWKFPPPKAGSFAMRSEGKLTVYSYPSANAYDAASHSRQLTEALPHMLTQVAKRIDILRELNDKPTETSTDLPFRLRLLAWMQAEMAAGVKETSENDSPRIKQYRTEPTYLRRATGKDLGDLPASEWCAMMLSFGVLECGGLDTFTPRVAGIELVEDAKQAGTYVDGAAGVARPGDGVIWDRKVRGGWQRHVTVCVEDQGFQAGTSKITTIGGNEANTVKVTVHDTRPLAIIRMGQA